jgi:hypothetical protein
MMILVSVTHDDIDINHAWRYRYESPITISASITHDDIGISYPWRYRYQLRMNISVSITHDDIVFNQPWYWYQLLMTISLAITHDDIGINHPWRYCYQLQRHVIFVYYKNMINWISPFQHHNFIDHHSIYFVIILASWVDKVMIFKEGMLHSLSTNSMTWLCSIYCHHTPILSLSMTYRGVCNKSNTTVH